MIIEKGSPMCEETVDFFFGKEILCTRRSVNSERKEEGKGV